MTTTKVRFARLLIPSILLACVGTTSVATAAPQVFSVAGQIRIFSGGGDLPLPGVTPGGNFGPLGMDAVGTAKTGTLMYQLSPASGLVGNCTDCITQDVAPGRSQPFLTVKPAVFTAPVPAASIGGFRGFPIPSVANLAQVTTRIAYSAPDVPNGTAMLSGRLTGALPTMTWCPGPGTTPAGAGGPNGIGCTSIANGDPDGPGPISNPNALIRYSGGNGFGGVMHSLLTSALPGGTLVRIVNNTPLRGQFEALAGSGSVGGGGDFNTDFFPGEGNAPIHTILGQTPFGFITSINPVPTSSPPNTVDRIEWNLPYTTGMVTIVAANDPVVANRTLTITGSDTRGSSGEGRLTLVAGAVGLRSAGNEYVSQQTRAKLLLYTPEPTTWLSAGSALIALCVGRSFAHRRTSKE